MTQSQNPFAFAFSRPPGELFKVVNKITRADISLIIPRMDIKFVDDQGNVDEKKRAELSANIEKYRACYVLGGRITATKVTKGRGDEPGVRFMGSFKAFLHPALGGQAFASARCHVPKFYEEVLYTHVCNGKELDPDSMLEFLVGIGAKPPNPGKPSIVGYEWTVEPLVSMDTVDDPVDALFARGKQFSLPAPTPPVAPAPVADPKPEETPAPTSEAVHASASGKSHNKRASAS